MRGVFVLLFVVFAVGLEGKKQEKHRGKNEVEPLEEEHSVRSLEDYIPLEESEDTPFKDEFKKMSNYKQLDKDACQHLTCKKREICLLNGDTGEAECTNKKLIRQMMKDRKKEMKHKKQMEKKAKKHHHSDKEMVHKKLSRARHEARRYKKVHDKHTRGQHKRVEFDTGMQADSPVKKAENSLRRENTVLQGKPEKDCSKDEMEEMGRRLLDWFKLLQDHQEPQKTDAHQIEKRNSRKKELKNGECRCQEPVSWQFQQLDGDTDGRLSRQELSEIENNGYEHCVGPFMDACDHDKDMQLSDVEWCCCFSDVLPPCIAAQKNVPAELLLGEPRVMPGAFVPMCDEDGFYKRQQCHGSTGYCWCVDRNGHEMADTKVQGDAGCDKYEDKTEVAQEDIAEK